MTTQENTGRGYRGSTLPEGSRIAVVGAGPDAAAVSTALGRSHPRVAVDVFSEPGIDASPYRRLGGSLRFIGAIESARTVDRGDLRARYDAVIYALDAEFLLRSNTFESADVYPSARVIRGLPIFGGCITNVEGCIDRCPGEFVLGLLQGGQQNSSIPASTRLAARVVDYVSSCGASGTGAAWARCDPAEWIRSQFPNAQVIGGAGIGDRPGQGGHRVAVRTDGMSGQVVGQSNSVQDLVVHL